MPETFAELGIPFPLFEASAEESSKYLGLDVCALCAADGVHCFRVADWIVACPKCGIENAVRGESSVCRSCRADVLCPSASEESLTACFRCLRAGRAAFTKDTVLGMVTWEQAIEGLTHGVPGLASEDFELVPSDDDPEWMRAKVSPSLLLELVRTPPYTTWQGERWHFCCGKPMIYVGEWKETEFKRHAPDGDGKAFFKMAVIDDVDESFWGILKNVGGPYMFRCPECGRLGGHYDMD